MNIKKCLVITDTIENRIVHSIAFSSNLSYSEAEKKEADVIHKAFEIMACNGLIKNCPKAIV
jgi:hypothetical protein